MLGLDAAADAAPAPRLLRVVDSDSGCALEDPLLRALAGPALRHAVHLLEGAGHGDDEGGLELLHLRHQPGDAARVPDAHALGHARRTTAGEDVRQRQEGQRAAVLVRHLAERAADWRESQIRLPWVSATFGRPVVPDV